MRAISLFGAAAVALLGGVLLISGPAPAQIPGPAFRPAAPSLPPSVTVAPGTRPTPSQQLDIQTYRNQLELSQQPSAVVNSPYRDQLNVDQQLNQLNMQGR